MCVRHMGVPRSSPPVFRVHLAQHCGVLISVAASSLRVGRRNALCWQRGQLSFRVEGEVELHAGWPRCSPVEQLSKNQARRNIFQLVPCVSPSFGHRRCEDARGIDKHGGCRGIMALRHAFSIAAAVIQCFARWVPTIKCVEIRRAAEAPTTISDPYRAVVEAAKAPAKCAPRPARLLHKLDGARGALACRGHAGGAGEKRRQRERRREALFAASLHARACDKSGTSGAVLVAQGSLRCRLVERVAQRRLSFTAPGVESCEEIQVGVRLTETPCTRRASPTTTARGTS